MATHLREVIHSRMLLYVQNVTNRPVQVLYCALDFLLVLHSVVSS